MKSPVCLGPEVSMALPLTERTGGMVLSPPRPPDQRQGLLGRSLLRDGAQLSVTADRPFGPVPPLTYILDLMDWKGHMDRPSGSVHLLTKAVESIGEKLG